MWSADLEERLNSAFKDAQARKHEYITVEHLLLALLEDDEVIGLLSDILKEKLGSGQLNLEKLKDDLRRHINETTPVSSGMRKPNTVPTSGFQRVLQRAYTHVQTSRQSEVTAKNVLVAIFSERESEAVHLLRSQDISRFDVVRHIAHGGSLERSQSVDEAASGNRETGAEDEATENQGQFLINLNRLAEQGKIDPLIGRQEEIQRVLQILIRRKKNNPLLVGEPGVGKTAIAEGLALKIAREEVPAALAASTVYSLDMGAILAGTRYRGDFEKRFKGVIAELEEQEGSIVFIDEIHTLIGAGAASGGVMDASNLIKPALCSGTLRCMGSTTYQEYRGIFDKDRALSRRFQKIDILEPTPEDTYSILKGLLPAYEEHYSLRYTSKALKSAVRLSSLYIKDRFLPDKAIDVIDEAGAAQKLLPKSKQHKQVSVGDIEQVVARMARVPIAQMNAGDKTNLMNLEQKLKLVVFGQDHAIRALVGAIKLSRAGLKPTEKPVGSFLFAGPTGVGKTEISRQLASVMGIELLRYDMSEYMERHTVSRLIGAPPGYVGYDQGGLLTEAIGKHPHCVLLLDEIEKAHPDVFNLLLQVMDHGTLTDNNGRHADFSNVILIMTTNAGAEAMSRRSVGFSEQNHASDGSEAIKKLFAPEFRNRLDEIVHFNTLNPTVVATVVDKLLSELQASLDSKKVTLSVSPEARAWLATEGYSEKMGARPMRRLIDQKIKHRLADDLLFGKLSRGGTLSVTLEEGELVLAPSEESN